MIRVLVFGMDQVRLRGRCAGGYILLFLVLLVGGRGLSDFLSRKLLRYQDLSG